MIFEKIVLNIPHSSNIIPSNVQYEDYGKLLRDNNKWTDYYTDIIFNPSKGLSEKISLYKFNYSRFYIDVERLPNDPMEEIGQGIIYKNFNGNKRIVDYDESLKLYELYNSYINSFTISENSLLIDCHSFPSDLSDTQICIGFNEDESKPDDETLQLIYDTFSKYNIKNIEFNNPYSNSLTPVKPINYKSVMLEINKSIYMNEETLQLHSDWYKIGNIINSLYRKLLL